MFIWPLTRILQRKALKKIDNPHQGQYLSLSKARSICLLINASEAGALESFNIFRKEMTRRRIDTVIVCLDCRKKSECTDTFTYTDKDIVLGKNLTNWYDLPLPEVSDSIAGQKFDMVIDFTIKKAFTLEYILHISKSTLRLGIDPKRVSDYDIIIQSGKDIEETTAPSQEELMKYIINYLNSIN